jgi:hypothetical protein
VRENIFVKNIFFAFLGLIFHARIWRSFTARFAKYACVCRRNGRKMAAKSLTLPKKIKISKTKKNISEKLGSFEGGSFKVFFLHYYNK